MSVGQTFAEIAYPESDGMPMAETELHQEWMIDLRNRLKYRYRNERVYVGCNMFVYYVEGDPHKVVAPDVFVVKDCDPTWQRRTFKTWEEQRTPDVVFEVTSDSTRHEDEQLKPQTYAKIGVTELFLYDPTGDYLDPMLQGYRFSRGRRTRIRPDTSGALECRALGIRLELEHGALRQVDARTGRRLLTEAQAAHAQAKAAARRAKTDRTRADAERTRADAERTRADAERSRADAADARARAAEEELRKLREQLRRRGKDAK